MRTSDYSRIGKAILDLDRNFRRHPRLDEMARAAGLSAYHFQRLFTRWAGISPKRFLQFLTAEHAARLLRESPSVLDAAYGAGLSGPGRLHDLTVGVFAATPGEVRSGGGGLAIRFGAHPSPFGDCVVAVTARGVCGLAFLSAGVDPVAELRARWPRAALREDRGGTRAVAERIFDPLRLRDPAPLAVFVRGTNFQLRVWEALLRIPPGRVVSYGDVAAAVGAPAAARAVGNAVARNPVAFLIPCHRVIRETGAFGDYRWGAGRKRAILAWEAARSGAVTAPGTRRDGPRTGRGSAGP